MSRIEDLIADLCPDGVEYRPMWRLTSWDKRFNAVERSKQPLVFKYNYFLANDLRPLVVDGGDVKLLTTNTSNLWTSEELAGDMVSEGEVVAIPWGGNPNVQYYKGKFLTADNRIAVSNDTNVLDTKFLYHFMQNNLVLIGSFYRGSGIKHPSMAQVLDLPIPLPPLEVQREIVAILDTFAELEAELEAELVARKRQYEYYRDSLLSFYETEVRRIPIGDLASVVRGASPRPIQSFITDAEDGVPWIKIGDVLPGDKYITGTAERVTPAGSAKSRRIHPGDFVLSNSMSFGRPYISKIEGCIHDGWLAISDFSASFLPDFLYHLLSSAPIQAEFMRRAGSGTVRNLNAEIVKAVALPVPPFAEQEHIVNVLDKFDALVNDLSIGLPAELAARRKQYEYYRDQLLTFEDASA